MVASNYFKNRFRKGKGKAKAKRPPPMKPKTTFAQRVNQIIAGNVENKKTVTYNNSLAVCRIDQTTTPEWYLQKDWNVKLFTISQGVSVQQRIGNQLKLKRWVIKGQIAPTTNNQTITCLNNTLCGHVDVYFGRLLNNEEISNTLTNFLDSGSSSTNPTGKQDQIFRPVNKDEYKIYWHKRFKMSPSQNQITPAGNNSVLSNNGFSLIRTFGFDVCQYICKNAIIKYNDSDNDPNNDMIRRLALWATWTPAIGDMGTNGVNNHFYNINLCAYAEYEDA